MNRKKLYDMLERLGWTVAQGVVAIAIVWSQDANPAYAPLIMGVLSVAKSYVAGRIGNTNSVSTLPESLDPATKA